MRCFFLLKKNKKTQLHAVAEFVSFCDVKIKYVAMLCSAMLCYAQLVVALLRFAFLFCYLFMYLLCLAPTKNKSEVLRSW